MATYINGTAIDCVYALDEKYTKDIKMGLYAPAGSDPARPNDNATSRFCRRSTGVWPVWIDLSTVCPATHNGQLNLYE